MRILAVSDTHRKIGHVINAVDTIKNIDLIVHAGDYLRDFEDIKSIYPGYNYLAVPGNGDFGSNLPYTKVFEFNNVKVMLTHGHMQSVKKNDEGLIKEAKKQGAEIVIFGHTHKKVIERKCGLWLINPGGYNSAPRPGCALIAVEHGEIGCCFC